MDVVDLNEALAAIQEGASDSDRFAALCLTEFLREICQLERSGGILMYWEWEARARDVASVCGLGPEAGAAVWEWCRDISGDMLLEPVDCWEP